ncbi:MAG: hypothetical protein QW797_08415, partial [Thermoproteota archaeon]
FLLTMISFYVAPYVVLILHIPYSKFTYPDIWLWGVLFFAIVSYLIGSIFCSRPTIIIRIFKNRGKLRAGALCLLFFLTWLYLYLLGLPPVQSAAGSTMYVAFLAFLLRRGFSKRVSILLTFGSLAAMVLSFMVVGGIPLLNPIILRHAKLSPVKELALPLFLLGAVSFSLNRMRKGGVTSYALSLAVFTVGAVIFALNGDMHDLFAISLGCFFVVLYRCSNTGKMLIVGSMTFIGLLASYLFPNLLGLFRQSINLQVLRHILLLVDDPVLGYTKGAISLGLRRDFLGIRMIYGEGENWTLTSTWLGPAYLDLGLLGVFLTMFTLGATLELMLQVLKIAEDDINPATLYLTTLSIVVSLLEDGASLPVVMFIVLTIYAIFSQSPRLEPPRSGYEAGGLRRLFLPLLAMSLIGLGLSAYAYCSEFGELKKVVCTQEITQRITQVDLVLELGRFYHVKIFGPGTVCLGGNMTILSDTGGTRNVLRQVSFGGCLWEAEVDQIDLGWFNTEEYGSRHVVLLELAKPPREQSKLYLRVETPSLSPWVTNEAVIQVGVCINFFTVVLLAINGERLKHALNLSILRHS